MIDLGPYPESTSNFYGDQIALLEVAAETSANGNNYWYLFGVIVFRR